MRYWISEASVRPDSGAKVLPQDCFALAEGHLNIAIGYIILGRMPKDCYDNGRCVKKLNQLRGELRSGVIIGFIDYESSIHSGDKRIRVDALIRELGLTRQASSMGVIVYKGATTSLVIYLVLFDGGPERVIQMLTGARLSYDALRRLKREEIIGRAKECKCPSRPGGDCWRLCMVAGHTRGLLQQAGFTSC